MLSYQHEFHAGNKADVFKHSIFSLILENLCKKEKPFTVIDTHAGSGRYNLFAEESLKTGEAQQGIKLIFEKGLQTGIKYFEIQKPYLSLDKYAGSPEITRHFMREKDIMFAVDKHPKAFENLQKNMSQTLITAHGELKHLGTVKVLQKDSFEALKALVPPLVKRGVILMDPSFEDESDYRQVTESLKLAHKKWNTAIIALWYPLLTKKQNLLSQMLNSLEDYAKTGINPSTVLRSEVKFISDQEIFELSKSDSKAHLYGTGMLIINVPFGLEEKINIIKQLF